MKISVLKILFIPILITLGWHHTLLAQTVINVEHVDAIKLKKGNGEPSFYQRKENQYQEIEINLYEEGNKRFKFSGKWQTYKEIMQPGEEFIPVNGIRSYNPKSFLKYLTKYQFLTFDANKGDTSYYSLQLFNPYKALIREMDALNEQYQPDSSGEWPRYYFDVTSFVILKFRSNKCILLNQDKGEYFIPSKKKDRIFIKDYPFDTARVVRQQPDNRWKEHDEILQQIIESYLFHDADYVVESTDDEKQILIDTYGNRLLPDSYDSIEKFEYFIFASKGENTEVYNLFLKPLFRNVRSYTLFNNYPQLVNMIIGDYMIQGDYKGITTPTKPYAYVPRYGQYYRSSSENVYIDINKSKSGYYLFSSFHMGKEDNDFKQKDSVLLPEGVQPENVTTIHSTEFTQYRGSDELLIAQRGKFFGLFLVLPPAVLIDRKIREENFSRYKDTIYTGVPVQCKELLPITFDSISRYRRDGHDRLLLYKDGLTGIYPLQKEARYLSIEKPNERQLLRFELPDHKKGWLNLVTNKEFLDQ